MFKCSFTTILIFSNSMVTLILLFSLSLPMLIIIHLLRKTQQATKTRAPPGPPGLPLIGNLHQLAAAKDHHIYLCQLSKKYGPIMRMKLGSKTLLVISSPQLAKQVLKTQDSAFCSRPDHAGQRKMSYNRSDIAFSPYNHSWRELRKITAIHLFSLPKVQSYGPILADEVSRAVQKISGLASSDQVVNLSDVTITLSAALICRIAFGKRYDEGGSEMRRFKELQHEAQATFGAFYVSDYFPGMLSTWVDKLRGTIYQLDKAFRNSDAFYQGLIDEHLDPNRPKRMDGDIIDTLIQLKQSKSCSIEINWDHIKALLMNIFLGGTDTASATVVWAMTALIKAPDAMKKAQDEIRTLLSEKGQVDEGDLLKLPYLKAVVRETLRLYPPAPLLLPRETIEKCSLGGYQIQPKIVVYVNAWAVARDPERWESPDEFLPERFLNNDIDIKGQDFGVFPFGSGRRSCPGISMGLVTVEMILANLLYSFDWELPFGVEAKDVDTHGLPGLAVHKKNPLLLVAKKYVA